MGCVSEDDLLEYVERRLPRGEEAAVERHLRACDGCRRTLAELARTAGPEALVPEGEPLGRYELLEPIGAGGMGVVYAARDPKLRRTVALKMLQPGGSAGAGEAKMRERLLREARAMARLSHPNVLSVYDVGELDGRVFLAMELVQGGTATAWLRQKRRSWREVLEVFLAAARGLAAAHSAGLIHRDFKPDNVLVGDDGRVRVTDFGLASALAPAPGAPAAGREGAVLQALTATIAGASTTAIAGSPAYMAPEQLRGEKVDARADVFSFCVALYEAVYGEHPFAGDSLAELEDAIRQGRIRKPPRGNRVPQWLRRTLLRGLRHGPNERFRSMDAVVAAIEKARRGARRRIVVAGTLLAALLAAAATAYRSHAGSRGRVVLSVADFVNETGEKDLDGLSGMLITALEQSNRFSVLTRARLIDLARQGGAERVDRIDEALGRDLCRRGGATALVVAAVRKFGNVYAIDMKVLDPEKQAYLMSFQERGRGKESIPGQIDALSERTRRGFSERRAEFDASRVKVADAITPSLAAYQHYFQGEQLLNRLTNDFVAIGLARDEFRKAIALDPNFALAHYRLAHTLVLEDRDASGPIAAAAARLASLGAKDRAYVLALQARFEKRRDDAIARYEELLRAYPAEKEAHLLLAQVRCALGVTDPSEYARGAEEARAALALDPGYTLGSLAPVGESRAPGWQQLSAWEQLIVCEHFADDLRGWLAAAKEYVRRVPSARSMAQLGYAELAFGHASEAMRAFAQAERTYVDDPEGTLGLAMVRLKQDDFVGAEREYRRLLGGTPAQRREGRYGLSWTSAFRGRYREAARRLDEVVHLDRQLRDSPDLARAYGHQALWLSLASRDFGPSKEKIDRGLEAVDPAVEPAIVYRHFYWFAVMAALQAGRREVVNDLVKRSAPLGGNHFFGILAVEALRRAGEDAKAREALRARTGRRLGNGLEAYAAEWALAEKRYEDAIDASLAAEADPFYHHPDVIAYHASVYPRVLLIRAKARAALGRRDAARSDLDRLLALWRDADEGAPAVEEARALRRRL